MQCLCPLILLPSQAKPSQALTNSSFSKVSLLFCCALTLAACGGGGGDESGTANNNTPSTNQAPTNVALASVQANSSDAIDVTWSLAKDDKTIASTLTYQVHLSESANFSPSSTTLKFSQKGAVATKLTGLKAATVYHLKLVVVDDDGAQTISAEKVVTTPTLNVINQAPTNVVLNAVTTASTTAVNVTWTAATDDSTPANQLTYELHIAEGGDFTPSASTLKFSSKNALTTSITGLKVGTTYTVKLVAVDAQGFHTVSSSISVTTQSVSVNQPPSNVVLTVQATSQTAVNASWTAASDDSTPTNQLTYEVHIAEGGDFTPTASTLKFSGQNVTTAPITGLKAGTAYTVKLVAVDAQGLRTVSSGLSVTTDTTPPTIQPMTIKSNVVVDGGLLPYEYTNRYNYYQYNSGLTYEIKTPTGINFVTFYVNNIPKDVTSLSVLIYNITEREYEILKDPSYNGYPYHMSYKYVDVRGNINSISVNKEDYLNTSLYRDNINSDNKCYHILSKREGCFEVYYDLKIPNMSHTGKSQITKLKLVVFAHTSQINALNSNAKYTSELSFFFHRY